MVANALFGDGAAGAPRPCVALGFGPGPMAEAVLFR
jgi:hypothetical protein